MSNNFVKFLAKVCPVVSIDSKRPKIMCFGYQSSLKKLITNAKISWPTFDIHKSKLVVTEWHSTKVGKTYNCLVFSTNLSNNSLEKKNLEGKIIMGHKCILNLFNQLLSTNCKGRWFLTIKRIKSSRNCFCYTPFFLKGSFTIKKLDMELEETFGFFLEDCLSSSLKRQLISFSNFFKILGWSKLTCFLNATMPLDELHMINPFLTCVFGFIFNIGLLW